MKNVSLWGPSAAGKTFWLAQLYLRFKSIETRWRVYPTRETQAFIDRERRKIVEQREFPIGTRKEAEDSIAYEFEHPDSSDRISLFTEDRAGVRSETLDEADVSRFAQADGLVMLLDAKRANYESEFLRAMEYFHHAAREQGRDVDSRPVAICLSKADELIRTIEDLRFAEQRPDEFVRQRISPEIERWIHNYYPRHRLFPVSPAGLRVSFGVVRPAVFFDERLRLRPTGDGAPLHLFTPFEWLFERIGAR